MEQNKYLYQDISELLDVISLILSEQKIAEIGRMVFSSYLNFDEIKNNIDLDPDSQQEQCLVAMAEAYRTHTMPDFLAIALQSFETIDFHKLWVMAKNGSLNSQLSCPSSAIITFYNSKQYKTLFFDLLNANEEIANAIDSILKDACSNPNILDSLSQYINNEQQLRDFVSCLSAATIEENFKGRYNHALPPIFHIKVAKRVCNRFLDDYSYWNSIVTNKIEQLDLLETLNYYSKKFISECSNDKMTDEEKKSKTISVYKMLTLNAFLLNWAATSENWFDYINHEIDILCDTPVNTQKFVSYLKNCNDGILIATLYNEYCSEKRKEPKFPIKLVLDYSSKPQKDNDSMHLSWYEAIPIEKVKGRKDEYLLNALIKLYNVLVSGEYIPSTTPLKIFIYRFSGFLPSYSNEQFYSIEWIGKKNQLATLISLLYSPSPKYEKCLGYFEPKISNGSSLVKNANADVAYKIKKMLYDCGFTSL